MEYFNPTFFAFLAVVLTVVTVLPGDRLRRLFLTIASCFFYAYWDWRNLGLLWAISSFDWLAAAQIDKHRGTKWARYWLHASIASNVAALCLFKYAYWLSSSYNVYSPVWFPRVHWPLLVVPVGISFYTFKSMSYTIDVFRGKLKPCRNWFDYTLFVAFFPEMMAGPIVRASIFLPQLARRPGPDWERLRIGANIFLQGLTKKILIADRLGEMVNPVFNNPAVFSSSTTWLAIWAFWGQIYCDFSGYSDMAIGIAKMLGYDLPMNFNLPYLSTSLTQFWRCWHITLGHWVRDYLYAGLGARRSKVDPIVKTVNRVFLVCFGVGFVHFF